MASRVLVVEDQPALRQHAVMLVRATLTDSPEIFEAKNGSEGLNLTRTCQPDLIIMDISMPDMSGIKVAKEIWLGNPKQRILFWSQHHREAYLREIAIILPDEAIHGYALKSEPDEKFTYAITSLLWHNNPYIDPLVRDVQVRVQSKDNALSDAEYETLLDIALGLTDKAIAARRNISVRGVQNRLAMLLDKLLKGKHSHLKETANMEIFNQRTRLIFEAFKRGLLDPDEISKLEADLDEWLDYEFSYDDSTS